MAKKKKHKRKFRLKTKFKRFLVYLAFFLVMICYTVKESYGIYQDFQYQKTYEYKLLNLGYTEEETNAFIKKMPAKMLDKIVKEEEKNDKYGELVKQKYFLAKNFEQYLEYSHDNKKLTLSDVVARVNVHANYGWYGVTFPTKDALNEAVMVNKFYKLDDDYVRDDIVPISPTVAYYDNKAAQVVIDEYLIMRDDVKNAIGVNLMVNSSYRSFEEQKEVYEEFKLKGQSYADAYAARPGFSEHQTGLALDITSLEHKSQALFKESSEYQWLKENCYKYGFILRYPEGKENITGYNTESWHFRYVGKELAKKIYDEGITFDEYYAFYLE